MKRIVIIGTTGSGKTTLAQRLSGVLGLPYTDLDDLRHLPGWRERDDASFRDLAAEMTAGGGWVIAGNYSQLREVTWGRADTVIWLDYPWLLTFQRLLARSIRRCRTGEPVCNGNTETWQKVFFSKESILLWFLKSFYKNRRRYGEIFGNSHSYPHLTFIRLCSPKETEQWLTGIQT